MEARLARGIRGRFAYCGNLQACRLGKRKPQRRRTFSQRPNRIRTRKNQPIVAVKLAERPVQRVKVLRWPNLQHRNFDRLGAQRAQSFAELAGLVSGARHQYAAAG